MQPVPVSPCAGMPLKVAPPLLDQMVAAGPSDPEAVTHLPVFVRKAAQPVQARSPRLPRPALQR